MAKGTKKEGKTKLDPEGEERLRLKRLAVSNGLISDAPAKASTLGFVPLSPTKTVVKHHGKDIMKKSQRKNRYLFSFPGLLAPVAGGKIGELKDLGTKNPILYLEFPQGRMKMFGTIMYPKNRYLTLQFPKGGKNVMCEDSFDTMIVFSDAWWVGRKEENPDEIKLDLPKELSGEQPVECDFSGGAGAITANKMGINNDVKKFVKEQTLPTDLEENSHESESNVTESLKETPTRKSARTSRKTFKFAEASSSDDDDAASDDDIAMIEDTKGKQSKADSSTMLDENLDSKVKPIQPGNVSGRSLQVSGSASRSNHGSLVQSTISTLFKKAEEKKEPRSSTKSTPLKATEQKSRKAKSARKIDLDEADETRKKRKLVEGTELKTTKNQPESSTDQQLKKTSQRKKSLSGVDLTPNLLDDTDDQVKDDPIEELSSSSQETLESDEDWAGDF